MLNQVYQVIENRNAKYNNNSNPELFIPGPIRTAFIARERL